MNPLDLWRFVRRALSAHKVRTRLSMSAVAIGVAAVLVLISLGETAKRYVLEQFGGLGSNLVIVTPGKVETSGGPPMVSSGTRDLTIEDTLAIARQVPGVVDIAPVAVATLEAASRGRRRDVIVVGTTDRFISVRNLRLAAGRNLPSIDPHQAAPVCLLGTKVARALFPDANPLGRIVRLGEHRVRAIGLIGTRGTSLGVDFDEVVLAPVASVQGMIDRRGLFRIIIQARTFEAIPKVQDAVRALLTHRHRQEDFTIITQQAVLDSLGNVLEILTAALAAIAAISLLVAGVGIMNVMLISVAERTPEIGLMKAVGASSRQVLSIFVAEACVLALSGGAIGLAIGTSGIHLLGRAVPEFPAMVPLWAIEAGLAIALLTGVTFGALPALRAARMAPVEALRQRG